MALKHGTGREKEIPPMKDLWLTQGAFTLIVWILACLTVMLLLKYNREDKNPLEWRLMDRCLLIIAMFCFLGGAGSAVIGIGVSTNLEHLPWIDPDVVRSYHQISRIVVMIWVVLLFLGMFLRRRARDSSIFAHTVVQYNAIYVALVCYAFGSITHPGPFLLGMALGTLNFLLFDRTHCFALGIHFFAADHRADHRHMGRFDSLCTHLFHSTFWRWPY